jgi:hypothetical protein
MLASRYELEGPIGMNMIFTGLYHRYQEVGWLNFEQWARDQDSS